MLHSVEITNFLSDIKVIATTYPGGVVEYVRKAKKLIQDSAQGVNPFDGYEAKVPILWWILPIDPIRSESELSGSLIR